MHGAKTDDLKLLEVATGDADMIPQVKSCIYPGGQYITANMNKILNQSLSDKTKDLQLNMRVIEDAAFIEKHIGREYVDVKRGKVKWISIAFYLTLFLFRHHTKIEREFLLNHYVSQSSSN